MYKQYRSRRYHNGTDDTMMAECRVQLAPGTSAKGKLTTTPVSDVPVHSFAGLPYAQPPVGELRFRPPQPVELWSGERDCTDFGVQCPQPAGVSKMMHDLLGAPFIENMSEDCLYLNVYTPSLKSDAKLPVMFWIHGGGFCLGTGMVFDGSVLAALHNVVVVAINYRLGMFGFFTTGDDVVPGNYGFLDQVEAMKWVQKHISVFGGDPDNVTIFGESAGGFSTSLHVVSDLTRGLFKRAIIQSGPATGSYTGVTQKRALQILKPHLDALGYKGSTSHDLEKFMRERTADELASQGAALMSYKCVIDGHYLKDFPINLYNSGHFNEVDLIAGCTSHEGHSMLPMVDAGGDVSSAESQRNMVNTIVNMLYANDQEAITDAVCKKYITPEAVGNTELFKQQFCDLYGHMQFMGPNNILCLKHSEKAPVYTYSFAHRSSTSVNASWAAADHGEDILPTFGHTLLQDRFDENDRKNSRQMMAYFTNFAKTGDPNGPGLPKWSPFKREHKAYMILKAEPQGAVDFEPEKMEFWENEMPKLTKRSGEASESYTASANVVSLSEDDFDRAQREHKN